MDTRPDGTAEDELAQARRKTFSPGRMALQALSLLIGGLLVWWCVRGAANEDVNWSRLSSASAGKLAALVGISLVSAVLNGWAFHVTCPAVLTPGQKRPGFFALQAVNAAATLGNFALRLGMFERVVYHLRVDRMRAMQIAAWFTLLLASVLAPTAAAGVALIAGVTSLGPLLVVMVLGTAVFTLLGQAVCVPLQRFRGLGPLAAAVSRGPQLYPATALRLADIFLLALRTKLAADIVGIPLDYAASLSVCTAAALASLSPLGRFGFREAGMAVTAAALARAGDMGRTQTLSKQLAVVDSLGELTVAVTFGAVATIWLIMRVLRAGGRSPATPVHGG